MSPAGNGHVVNDAVPAILDTVYLPNVGNYALSGPRRVADLANQTYATDQTIVLGSNPLAVTRATIVVNAGVTISGTLGALYNGAFWCDQLLLQNNSRILMANYLLSLGAGVIYIGCNVFTVQTAATLTTGAGSITIMTKKYTADATITRNIQSAGGVLTPDTNAKIYEINRAGTTTTLRDFNSSWDNS